MTGKPEHMLAVCDLHGEARLNLSFVLGLYRMPSHWIDQVTCSQRNCYRPATHWLVVDLSEAVFGIDPPRDKLREGKRAEP